MKSVLRPKRLPISWLLSALLLGGSLLSPGADAPSPEAATIALHRATTYLFTINMRLLADYLLTR
ncbi:MAG: hypothetical protein M9920_05780 [Verrucomicrobiae bacterium]|nr:hypothetical protein [Verrucomicrobiae bacterium]